jgi:hypothetical protein
MRTVTLEWPGSISKAALDHFAQQLLWEKALGPDSVIRMKVGAKV